MIKVCSLFSGIGGMDYYFHNNTNYQMVFVNDFNPCAIETYKSNFGDNDYIHEGDLHSIVDKVPDHDLLLFGFPCQPFSLSGKRLGFDDKRADVINPVLHILETKKSDYFIMENVKGLLTHNKGKTFQSFLDYFNSLGYNLEYKLVKCEEHGVPQKRHRVFIFGFRMDLNNAGDIFKFPSLKGIKCDDVFKDVYNKHLLGVGNHNLHTGSEVKRRWMKLVDEGENMKNLSNVELYIRCKKRGIEFKQRPKGFQSYIRFHRNQIANTMAFGNTCLPIHPYENRSISMREALSFQTFPDDFVLKGTGVTSKYKQIGNAVPPLISKYFSENLIKLIGKSNE